MAARAPCRTTTSWAWRKRASKPRCAIWRSISDTRKSASTPSRRGRSARSPAPASPTRATCSPSSRNILRSAAASRSRNWAAPGFICCPTFRPASPARCISSTAVTTSFPCHSPTRSRRPAARSTAGTANKIIVLLAGDERKICRRNIKTTGTVPVVFLHIFGSDLLGEIEPVRVHHLCPGRHEVLDEFLFRIGRGIDLGECAQLRVRAEDQVDARAGPFDRLGLAVATFVGPVALRRPLVTHVEQVDEEVVGQLTFLLGQDAVFRTARIGAEHAQAADQHRHLRSA